MLLMGPEMAIKTFVPLAGMLKSADVTLES